MNTLGHVAAFLGFSSVLPMIDGLVCSPPPRPEPYPLHGARRPGHLRLLGKAVDGSIGGGARGRSLMN